MSSQQTEFESIISKYGNKKQIPEIIELEWENLYAFDKKCFINFKEVTKLQIMGANASGKSSIFNILLFALFGVKAGYINNPLRTKLMLCNKNNKSAYVKCIFKLGNQAYKIQRFISRKFVIENELSLVENGNSGEIFCNENDLNLIDRDDYLLYFMAKQQRINIVERSPTEFSRILTNEIYSVVSNPAFANIKLIADHTINDTIVIGNFKINFHVMTLTQESIKEIHTISKVFKSLCEIFINKQKSSDDTNASASNAIYLSLAEIPDYIKCKYNEIIANFSTKENNYDLVNLHKLAEFYSSLTQQSIDNYNTDAEKVCIFSQKQEEMNHYNLIEFKKKWNIELRKVSHKDHILQIDILPLKILHNNVEFSNDVISGYQRFILDLTFRVVNNINILFIDEGFGCCDDKTTEILTNYLLGLDIPVIVNTNISISKFMEIKINNNCINYGRSSSSKTKVEKIISGELSHERNFIGGVITLLPNMQYLCTCCDVNLFNRAAATKHLHTVAHVRKLCAE